MFKKNFLISSSASILTISINSACFNSGADGARASKASFKISSKLASLISFSEELLFSPNFFWSKFTFNNISVFKKALEPLLKILKININKNEIAKNIDKIPYNLNLFSAL